MQPSEHDFIEPVKNTPDEKLHIQPTAVRDALPRRRRTKLDPPDSPFPGGDGFTGYKHLADHNPNIVLIVRKSDNSVLYANQPACSALNMSLEELSSQSLYDLLPEASAPVHTALEQAAEICLVRECLHLHLGGNSHSSCCDVSIDGVEARLCVMEDPRLEQTRQALRENEERLRLAHEVAGLGTWDWQPGWENSIHNDIFFQIHGLSVPDDHRVDLKEYLQGVHPEDRDSLVEEITRTEHGEEIANRPFRFTGEDGLERWILCHRRNFYENGRLSRQIGAARDVTAQIRYEMALNRANAALQGVNRQLSLSEQLFRRVTASMDDFVFTLDCDQRHTSLYGSQLESFGITPEFFLGKSPSEVLGEEKARVHEEANQRALQGENVTYVWSVERDGEEFFFQTRLSPLRDEDGSVVGIVGLGRDVTQMKLSERTLEEYARRLERSNQELQDFAYVASHDLQEPLRKIQQFSENLNRLAGSQLDETAREYLLRMNRASERMQKMVNSLLELSRVNTQGRPFRSLELNLAVEDALNDLEMLLLRTGGKVHVDPLPTVYADQHQMRRLFMNLIGNALKYQQEGVTPQVHVAAEIVRTSEGERVRVSVEDNGIGFAMEHLERIFQPFQRLHGRNKYEGTGMGLAICRRIVERHGGQITAESQPGVGTKFVVSLPYGEKQAKPSGAAI
jgi:PAS domain S-box-containing protein